MGIEFGGEYFPSEHIGAEYFLRFGVGTRVLVHGISKDVGT